MRPPVVAGLGAGAGASTLAAALHGIDAGVWSGGPVDVLVARAGAGARQLPAGVPVVVLVAGGPLPAPPPGTVVLPVVPQWCGPAGGRAAAGLLRLTEERTPAALRPAAAALRAVVAALLRSGALERPCAPPALPRIPPLDPALAPPPVLAPAPPPAPAPRPPSVAAVPGRALPAAIAPVPLRRSRPVPVLLHRAAPAVPRLVAGAPLRWAAEEPAGQHTAGSARVGSGAPRPAAVEPAPVELRSLELRLTEPSGAPSVGPGTDPGPPPPARRRTLRAGLVAAAPHTGGAPHPGGRRTVSGPALRTG